MLSVKVKIVENKMTTITTTTKKKTQNHQVLKDF